MNSHVTIQLPRGFVLTLQSGDRSYTVATIDPPLPVETAMTLADATHPTLTFRRGASAGRLGEVIRAHGDCGCLSGDELATYGGGTDVETWHVDAPEGVAVLVQWLTSELTDGAMDAAAARAQHRARKTEEVLREVTALNPTGFLRGMILDGLMDKGINADDPRWIALKARFREEVGRAT